MDFAGHDAEAYRDGLGRLMAAILERSPPPPLPDDLEIPDCPAPRLPAELREKLVAWLTPVLRQPPLLLRGLAAALGLSSSGLLDPPSAACGASNAVVLATGKDDAVLAALRIVDQLAENLKGIEAAERLAELAPLRRALQPDSHRWQEDRQSVGPLRRARQRLGVDDDRGRLAGLPEAGKRL